VWKVTDHWPLPSEPTSWYLHTDGVLQRERPATAGGKAEYVYDPSNPVQTLNGNHMPSSQYGPRDQRHLDERDDVLLFTSDVLDEPLEITGESWAELHISSDAPDTDFVVQLLDIYPDGYKWPVRENFVTTRFRDGDEKAQPLESRKTYLVKVPLAATALVVAKGHRLGVQVMSSSYPAYPVHPNTWDAIDSYAEAKRAHQTIHLSASHPSRIVLPVLAPGATRDFEPASASR
jgi:putative CocE/NonD family hydrolase